MEVGNKVRIVKRVDGHEFELGGVARIRDIRSNETLVVAGVDDFWWCRPEELEVVAQDEPITAVNRPEEQWEE